MKIHFAGAGADLKKVWRRMTEKREWDESLIVGRNAVAEALRAGRPVDTLYVAKGNRSLAPILERARQRGVVVKDVDTRKLDALCGHANHQGVVAAAAVKEYATLDEVFELARQRNEAPFLLIADGLNDPYNLGAVIRTAECAGAHGVIIPRRHSAGLTYAVGKASAGAVEYMPVVRVSNIAATLDELKKRGVWCYAADLGGTPWCEVDYSGAVALIIGSEGDGISRLVREKADFVVSLPICGKINSLNASVACGVLCYEVARTRRVKKSI